MDILKRIKGMFTNEKNVHIATDSMTLISREEFKTPLGTGIREIYKDGKRTLEIKCTPTEESLALENLAETE